jgi:hypothetical protein
LDEWLEEGSEDPSDGHEHDGARKAEFEVEDRSKSAA